MKQRRSLDPSPRVSPHAPRILATACIRSSARRASRDPCPSLPSLLARVLSHTPSSLSSSHLSSPFLRRTVCRRKDARRKLFRQVPQREVHGRLHRVHLHVSHAPAPAVSVSRDAEPRVYLPSLVVSILSLSSNWKPFEHQRTTRALFLFFPRASQEVKRKAKKIKETVR